MPGKNRLARMVAKFDRLPTALRRRALSLVVGRIVPYVGTSGLRIEEMTEDRVVVSIKNVRRVQNHIKGVHASAMVLIAETASGMLTGMNVPDDKLPLMKSLSAAFTKRSRGAMRAEATLTPGQRTRIVTEERGEVNVATRVTDETGGEPVRCEMIWAWVPKKS